MIKICYCSSTITGKPHKKYCSRKCQQDYNNRLNRDATNFMRITNNQLRKNRRILQSLLEQRTNRNTLDRLGFCFDLHTSLYHTHYGATYYYCYEYGYLIKDGGEIIVVRQQTDL